MNNHIRSFYRIRYQKRKAAGVCTSCGKEEARPGRVTCVACGIRATKNSTNRQRKLEPLQKALKICRYCDCREVMAGTRWCGYCQERRAEQTAAYRAARAKRGQCVDCKDAAVHGKTRCQRCLDRQIRAVHTYRDRKNCSLSAPGSGTSNPSTSAA